MSWTWDPTTRTYRETESGQTLGEAQLRPVARTLFNAALTQTRAITGELANGIETIESWELGMRRIVKETFAAAYALPRGGRNAMTPKNWGQLGFLAKQQYRFLNSFAQDIAAAGLTRDRALSRSDLYVASARQAYERGKLATYPDMPRLAIVPGDGSSTQCKMSCRCTLAVDETDAGFDVYWLDLGDDRECRDCQQLAAEWSPLQVARLVRAPVTQDVTA